MPTVRRKLLFRLLLVVGGLFVGLALAEISLRVLGVGFPRPFHPDPYCGTRLKPGFSGVWLKEGRSHFRVNSAGFRDLQRELEKPAGVFRVAIVGDSFIEALQVERKDSICACLEEELQGFAGLKGRRPEVMSFGVSGHGTGQQLQTLRRHVLKYDPDLVVLAFYPGNDIADNSRELAQYKVKPFFDLRDGELRLDNSFVDHPDFLRAQSTWTQLKVRFINASRVLQLAAELRDATRGPEPGPAHTDGPSVSDIAFVEPTSQSWTEAWVVTERLIEQFHRETTGHGARFLLMTIPTDEQVSPLEETRRAARRRMGVTDLGYYERRLDQAAKVAGFAILHLSTSLQQHAVAEQKFLHGFAGGKLGEGHWNEHGHRHAAKVLAARLRQLLENP